MEDKIRKHDRTLNVVRKSISQSKRDIEDMRQARSLASRAIDPKFYLIQGLYEMAADDALLSSQLSNRIETTVNAPVEITDANGTVIDDITAMANASKIFRDIIRAIVESQFFGYSVVELYSDNGSPKSSIVNRKNIDPVFGRFYPDATGYEYIDYRNAKEFGKWILEFKCGSLGLLNKTLPHIMFKKFAQSCWSELCEIYGIPPRYIKTNTQDPAMLERAETMLRDMGAASAFVIDETEEFSFAQGASTNGDVYNNLIKLCNNEISLVISGAIIGQDTTNGNYSKELISSEILEKLINNDHNLVTYEMNHTVIPALVSTGILKSSDIRFRFSAVEDNNKTWELVKGLLPYKDIDNKWIEEKFGIPVLDKTFSGGQLSLSDDQRSFFV